MINLSIAMGREPQELSEFDGQWVHPSIVDKLINLKEASIDAGFRLCIASGYRSFERQLKIWNEKAHGLRPVLDSKGQPIDIQILEPKQLVFAILRWSALPGTSRHHWGTDVDVYDELPSLEGYQLQLTVEETESGAVYGRFYQWLDSYLSRGATSFIRPYVADSGGLAPEPWHLSCAEVAQPFAELVTRSAIMDVLSEIDIAHKEVVLENFDEICDRFVSHL